MKAPKEIVEPLLMWYQEHARTLPWRQDPTPYHVWVSEIMLQQTRVEAVIDYYQRFITTLPTISSLATIEEERLLKLWEGLGYYSRVRNLQKTAKILCEKYHGNLPNTYQELISLPGIGAYTAGAIHSIAYQQKTAAVDGNVLRVMSRMTASSACIDEEKVKRDWKQAIEEIMPEESGQFNQALMELGATVCIPNGEPLCSKCPVSRVCIANQNHTQKKYPVRKEKKKRQVVLMTVLLFLTNDKVGVQKRDANGLLANFYEFPHLEGHLSKEEIVEYLKQNHISYTGIETGIDAKHIFTHIEWHMKSYLIWLPDTISNYMFSTGKQLKELYPLPGAFEKYKKYVENLWNEKAILYFPQE